MTREIAFIGFGEAARAIARGWGPARCASVSAYDLKLEGVEAPAIADACAATGVAAMALGAALAGARQVLCLVTADQAVAAARAAASSSADSGIRPRSWR